MIERLERLSHMRSGRQSVLRDFLPVPLGIARAATTEMPAGSAATSAGAAEALKQYELVLPKPLKVGHYRIGLRFEPRDADLSVLFLRINSGGGYSSSETVPLPLPRPGSARLSADFLLPRGAQALRLGYVAGDRGFVLRSASVRRQTRSEFYARLAAGGIAQRKATGRTTGQIVRRAVTVARQRGWKGLASELRRMGHIAEFRSGNYPLWIEANEADSRTGFAQLRAALGRLDDKPLISVVMPVYVTPERWLREAIESVKNQVYDRWELCIADDCSRLPHVRQILESEAALDPRVKIVFREQNQGIAAATNAAFALSSGTWVAPLDHDDLLAPSALAEIALSIAARPDAEIVYSDEDKISTTGQRFDPYFKPGFSRELFRSQNYLNHLTVHRAENVRAVGGWRSGFEGSQDYDLTLRILERIDAGRIVHTPKVLYHWRAVEGSTAFAGSEKDYAHQAGIRALREHLARSHVDAVVGDAPDTRYYRVRHAIPAPEPKVSLIIPTKDKLGLLRNCVDSIRRKTRYPNYEIVVVDNGSVESQTIAYLERLRTEKNVRVLRYDKPFNFSAMNNFAVANVDGSVVGLLNNDIEVVGSGWLAEMVSWAVQSDIGCVGAKLYYADDTIQHAGVILGIGGVAGHSHKYFPGDHPGYFSRLRLVQNLSAVTGACLLVRKSVYEQVGGLNEEHLRIAFNDVDFCLKVRAAGYQNVWTPYAELYHLESESRGAENSPDKVRRFQQEIAYMRETWELDSDPYYSPHLSLEREDFSIAIPHGKEAAA